MMKSATVGLITTFVGLGLSACTQTASSERSASRGSSAVSTGTVDGYGWCHDDMQATDGTTIAFDYVPQSTSTHSTNDVSTLSTRADPAWLNVFGYNLTGSENVRAVLLEYSYSMKFRFEAGYNLDATQQLDMRWDATSQRFTVQVPGGLQMYEYAVGDDDATGHMFQFAVVVDGNWLEDPVSGGHNFQYVPFDQAQDTTCKGLPPQ